MPGLTRCPSCQFILGAYVELFNRLRECYLASEKKTNADPRRIAISRLQTVDLEELFNALCIPNMCCRMHLANYIDLTKVF